MKKTIITTSLVLFFGTFAFKSNAQSISVSNDSLVFEGGNSLGQFDQADIHEYFVFKNISADSDIFRWKRIANALPSTEWESAVCDINLCHGVTVDSADFIMAQGDSGYFSLHFYPGFGHGTGEMKVEIYNVQNPSQKVAIKARATAWDAYNSVAKTELQKALLVYPNPADDILTIRFDKANQADVVVRNIQGAVVHQSSFNFNSGSEAYRFDTKNMANGVYILTVNSDGASVTQKVVINH